MKGGGDGRWGDLPPPPWAANGPLIVSLAKRKAGEVRELLLGLERYPPPPLRRSWRGELSLRWGLNPKSACYTNHGDSSSSRSPSTNEQPTCELPGACPAYKVPRGRRWTRCRRPPVPQGVLSSWVPRLPRLGFNKNNIIQATNDLASSWESTWVIYVSSSLGSTQPPKLEFFSQSNYTSNQKYLILRYSNYQI